VGTAVQGDHNIPQVGCIARLDEDTASSVCRDQISTYMQQKVVLRHMVQCRKQYDKESMLLIIYTSLLHKATPNRTSTPKLDTYEIAEKTLQ
jgi:hypothetical protein